MHTNLHLMIHHYCYTVDHIFTCLLHSRVFLIVPPSLETCQVQGEMFAQNSSSYRPNPQPSSVLWSERTAPPPHRAVVIRRDVIAEDNHLGVIVCYSRWVPPCEKTKSNRERPGFPLEPSEGAFDWRMGLPALSGGNLGCWIFQFTLILHSLLGMS